jgi:hypothetical protein
MGDIPAHHDTPVYLLKLVAVDGIVQEKRKVREQIETVVEQVAVRPGDAVAPLLPPVPRQAEAVGPAAV